MKDVHILVGTGGKEMAGFPSDIMVLSFLKISGLSVSGRIRKSPRTPCGATIRPTIIISSGFISVAESDDLSIFHQDLAAS